MIRVVIAAVIVAGCSYGAPDYGGTQFQCGDLDRCPPGQSCINEVCRGDEGGDGVFCDSEVCGAGEQCCVDGAGPPFCMSDQEICPGQGAFCDGVEDCRPGEYCCDGIDTMCCEDDFFVVCQDPGDCTPAEPECCHDDTSLPWGTCAAECL